MLLGRRDRWPMRALTADTPGGAALRRLVPAVVVVPMGLAALRLAGERAGLYPTVVGLSLLDTAIIALALPLASRLARSLDRADAHRRQADALRENEERARRIVDAAHDAFVAVDANGTICGWDHASERLFGYTVEEAIGADMAKLILPTRLQDAHRRGFARSATAITAGDVPQRMAMETSARHRDGREFPVELLVTAASDPAGLVFNGFLRDITERRRAHEALAAAHAELGAAQEEILHRLALAAEYRDDDTGDHTRRVGELAASLAARLGLPAQEVELIRRAAPLHDAGKIGIPDSILLKPGCLTPDEFEQVKAHTVIGAGLLAGRGFPLLQTAERIALRHHERWDGTGYRTVWLEEIPLVGRIVALADVFDALTHPRPYRPAWSVEDAVAELRSQRAATSTRRSSTHSSSSSIRPRPRRRRRGPPA